MRCLVAILSFLALLPLSNAALAQGTFRRNEHQMEGLIGRVEQSSERFRTSLDDAIKQNGLGCACDGSNIKKMAMELSTEAEHLKSSYDDKYTDAATVRGILQKAAAIDGYMWQHRLTPKAQDDWRLLGDDLRSLAQAYDVAWTWLGPIGPAYRMSAGSMKALIGQVETNSDRFRHSLDEALDNSTFNGTDAEDDVNRLVSTFEHATDRLKEHFNDENTANAAVSDVLNGAARIDAFMRQHRLTLRAQSDWKSLRSDIDRLANAYHTAWAWY
jgi:hypothetical protein